MELSRREKVHLDAGTAPPRSHLMRHFPERAMHKALRTVTVAIMLACVSTVAGAQTPPPRQELPTVPKLNLTLEQRHTIREFIKDMKAQATTREVKAAVGDPVP